MLKYINGLIMAFTMYTIIPMPQNKWEEKNYSYILINLPIIGLFIGILWYIVTFLLVKFNFSKELVSVISMFFPLFLTGFIHIDGYMDTCDAIFSRASLGKKKEILKDSRVGAFAVIGVIILFFVYYVSMLEILKKDISYLKMLIFLPIFSRGITILFVIKTKLIFENGFIASFKKDMNNKQFNIILLMLLIILVLAYFMNALLVSFINIILSIIISIYCTKQMNGISGDLCGFTITASSIFTLFILALVL